MVSPKLAGALMGVLLLAAQKATIPEAPEQPLPYSHKKHVALGLNCQGCHVNPEPGEQMTIPATAMCMTCHRTVSKDAAAIRKLAQFAGSKQAVPWVRVYAVGAGIYWSHRSHLQAGATCEDCHGDVPQMDKVARVKDVISMGGCIGCHKQNKASTGCEFCHEGR